MSFTHHLPNRASAVCMCETDLEVLNEVLRVFAQLAIEDGLPSPLQQQQLIKGLKDINAGLVDGAHYGSACVDNVAHCPHHNSSCTRIQPCTWHRQKP